MRTVLNTIAAVGLMAGLTAPAMAAPLDAELMLKEYNLIVFGDITSAGTAHVEGRTFIGGNLDANQFQAGLKVSNVFPTNANDSQFDAALVVGGDINGSGAKWFAGNAIIGGTINSSLESQGSATGPAQTGVAIDVAAVQSAFEQMSLDLSTLDATGSLVGDTFTSTTANIDGVHVINVDAADFAAISDLKFNVGGATTIINVGGTSFETPSSFNFNNAYQNVIFNFFEAEMVSITKTWGASILAPLAQVIVGPGGSLKGTVVANSVVQSMEVHAFSFDGTLPPDAVPLPAGFVLMATGLAGLAGVRSKRKRA
ncbi:collagen-binding domain-containing protein [Parvularcula sp. LCG005]|uniref:collagen-binding domain-containing protein n=1 Tax=Parvularcula sp. LCG005 TaxID=3078805 RepID=UPI002942E704|nr:collagen-binding domain-containing protein [Parvularcula sp. LCG005]WOI54329.1 choice-of-anchor A family protein [Parvularcula sp. LCG005]